jgi:integrase
LSNKYLYKRGNTYYFSKRINNKSIKISLKSNNINYCRMLRDKIIKSFQMKNEKEIMEKILNQEKISNQEAQVVYTQKELEEMDKQFKESNIKLSSQEQQEYIQEIFKEEIKIDRKIKELEEKKENKIFEIVKKLENRTIKINNPKKENNDIHANLEKYFNDYLEYKKSFDKVSKHSIKAYQSSFRYLNYLINGDTIFNFKTFKKLQQKLQELPKNFFKYKNFYEKPFEEVIKLKDTYEGLSNKRINTHINNYKSFFDYLVYEEIIEINPLANIRPLLENKEIKKEEYTPQELESIFNSDLEKEYINMCKFAIYTGLRIQEILSIKKSEIKDNLINLNLQDSSTKKHTRIIPVHKNLISVINYQKRHNKGSFLFFTGNSDAEINNVGKRINRRIRNIVNLKEKSFHSFRKNFSQEIELETRAEEKTKKYLMGHDMSKDITHRIYNREKMNIEKLKDCINQITFNF